MSSFLDKLLGASRTNDTLLCVGLDVDLRAVPSHLLTQAEPVLAFNRAIVEATADLVCAYKPNLAFYEALGLEGLDALRKTLACIPRDIPVIADAKRGDVGHSAKAYAQGLFDYFGFDAVTVNPYLGRDSLQPFLDYGDRGIFVLCKTSNPGSADLQDLLTTETAPGRGCRALYEVVAESVREWNTQGNCGLVVGATFPEELTKVRRIAPDLPILIPGVGAQEGDLAQAVRNGVDAKGELAVVNSARQVLYASKGQDFAKAAREIAVALRRAMNVARRQGV
ncbi:MAG: orotidine-5'-phosphate decarboxylase [Chloroflexi bacterium]|nr:orotidine-5'-phosphate decarboxylase [Chloroflexota bacterium]